MTTSKGWVGEWREDFECGPQEYTFIFVSGLNYRILNYKLAQLFSYKFTKF